MSNNETNNESYSNIQEKFFSNFIDDTIIKILNFASNTAEITSVLSFGSLAKKSMRNYSNLNLIFYSEKRFNSDLFDKITDLFKNKIIHKLNQGNKYLFYLNLHLHSELRENIFELEILLENNDTQLNHIYFGSVFTTSDLENIILLDKNSAIKPSLESILKRNENFKNNLGKFVQTSFKKFVEFFVKGNLNFKKTDLFQYYYYMSKCYSELTKLDSIYHNNIEDVISPVFAFARIDLFTEFPFYKQNIPNISITNNDFRKHYVTKILELGTNFEEKYHLDLELKSTEKLFNQILNETYFWNLRDIAYLDLNNLKKGTFFRSSTLSRYEDQPELKIFLTDNNIKTIIDLRSKNEYSHVPYKNSVNDITYINIPIGQKVSIDFNQLKYAPSNSESTFYELFMRFYQDEIKEIFNSLAQYQPGFVIHCYAGRDRTGVVTGLLLDLLGEKSIITRDLITEDYLNSGNNTQKEVFNVFNSTLNEFGGSRNYLESIGIEQEVLNHIIQKFTK